MPNHKSASKRMRQNVVRNQRNTAVRSRLRKALKKARAAVSEAAEDREQLVHAAIRELQKAGSKNVLHRSAVSRTVSRLQRASNRARG